MGFITHLYYCNVGKFGTKYIYRQHVIQTLEKHSMQKIQKDLCVCPVLEPFLPFKIIDLVLEIMMNTLKRFSCRKSMPLPAWVVRSHDLFHIMFAGEKGGLTTQRGLENSLYRNRSFDLTLEQESHFLLVKTLSSV